VFPASSATLIFSELLRNKICTTSVWPLSVAHSRAVYLRLLTTRTFAPYTNNSHRIGRWPLHAATRSGVFPASSASLIFSELLCNKLCTISVWPLPAANSRAVNRRLSTTQTFAPYLINFYRICRWPCCAARRSGVFPASSATSIFSELLCNKVCRTSVWPLSAAHSRAVRRALLTT
jgi:hypothetical protein